MIFENWQGNLSDVIGSTPDFDDHVEEDLFYLLDLDLDFDFDFDEDDREAYYHELDEDEDLDVVEDVDHDPNEIVLPFISGVSVARCLGVRCWDDSRLRCLFRKRPRYNSKPKRKNHRG